MLAAYNEERFISGVLEHLIGQGVEVYLIDNSSTDRTVEIAERYLGRGLIGIETLPREDVFDLQAQLRRKEELAPTFEADWIMHVDADEIHLPPRSDQTLAEALTEVGELGYNVVNFEEFVFLPTQESPDHDHPQYQETMISYYPFSPFSPRLMRAWQRQDGPVNLTDRNGHKISFPGMNLYPEKFPMKHYIFLSVEHILEKYGRRNFDEEELKRGMHDWRARLEAERIRIPSQDELRTHTSDDELDASNPRQRHIAADWASPRENERGGPPIIVGGCYRSGTSLLRRMLDSHSRIHCGPEIKFFRDLHGDYVDDPIKHGRFMNSARAISNEAELLELLGGAFVTLHERAAARSGKPRWADKNPENVIHLDEWERLLGNDWVFVHVVRNPLDTLASIKEAVFPLVIPADFEQRIALYRHYLKSGLDFQRRHPERYYRVLYEQLVEEPRVVMSGLMEWLGEKFQPKRQLSFNEVEHQKGLEDQKVLRTKRISSSSVGRWRETLTPDEALRISRECGPMWQQAAEESGLSHKVRDLVRQEA